ncbi:helix-turn-helix transcriptional regulator [Brevibacterium yomogidense]|uniref:helix-turn-helix transcriptional regulator n=1 Tax=Brevibacterium yomogidense TaxID=946573 RepID=UPI0018E02552|nr:helix-turn-helix transcriptional regulator [Brevibacterium yomogidense]
MSDPTAAHDAVSEAWARQSSPVVVPGVDFAPYPEPVRFPHASDAVPSARGGAVGDGAVGDDVDPFDSLASTVLEHIRRRRGAVVVLTGPYGAGHTDVVGAVNRGIPSVSDSGFAYVPRVDLLGDEHLRTVDAIVREGTRPVLFTATEVPDRYASVLGSQRGLSLALRPLDRGAAAAVIRRLTGVQPLEPTLTFLLELTGGLRGLLVSTVHMGLAERWLTRSGGRLVVGRPPSFTDRGWAEQEIALIARVVGKDGTALLSSLAVSGPRPLSDVMRESVRRREVVRLERLGVVRFDNAAVGLHPPLLAHALRLVGSVGEERAPGISGLGGAVGPASANPATDDPAADDPAADDLANVEAVDGDGTGDDGAVLREALADLEHGLLGNAYHHLEALASPRALAVRAIVDAVNGRPRTSMETLGSLAESTGSPDYAALREVVKVFTVRGVVFPDEQGRGEPSDPHLRELIRAARVVSDMTCTFAPTTDDDGTGSTASDRAARLLDGLCGTVEEPPEEDDVRRAGPCWGSWSRDAGGPDGPPPPDFVEVCRVVGRAFAAAVLGRDDDARAAFALLEQMDLTRLPVIGSSWVVEHVGLARLLVEVDEDPVPHDWFAGEPLGRPLLRSVSTMSLELLGALCRGGASPDLLGRLTDLWAVFETRKPSGIVTRDHVDALDFAVAGPMSTDLIGPPGVDVVTNERRPTTVSVRAAVEAGRLLRCAPDDLIEEWAAGARGALPGVTRLLARAVVLRRVGTLPARVCGAFADIAEEAGVEPEVSALLRAREADDPEAYDAARDVLRRTRPALVVPRWEPVGHDPAHFERSLRTSRLTGLTARERAVVVRVVSGDGTDGIAEALGISPRTVETHVRNAYRKLGVHSRTELRAEIVR